jgi:hypothetical protein
VSTECTGLLRTGLLSYVSRKEVAETSLVRVRVRSIVPVYALLYVGSGLLSYVSRKLKLLRNQSVNYVQKSVRIPNKEPSPMIRRIRLAWRHLALAPALFSCQESGSLTGTIPSELGGLTVLLFYKMLHWINWTVLQLLLLLDNNRRSSLAPFRRSYLKTFDVYVI